jgi:hypothetical protein
LPSTVSGEMRNKGTYPDQLLEQADYRRVFIVKAKVHRSNSKILCFKISILVSFQIQPVPVPTNKLGNLPAEEAPPAVLRNDDGVVLGRLFRHVGWHSCRSVLRYARESCSRCLYCRCSLTCFQPRPCCVCAMCPNKTLTDSSSSSRWRRPFVTWHPSLYTCLGAARPTSDW